MDTQSNSANYTEPIAMEWTVGWRNGGYEGRKGWWQIILSYVLFFFFIFLQSVFFPFFFLIFFLSSFFFVSIVYYFLIDAKIWKIWVTDNFFGLYLQKKKKYGHFDNNWKICCFPSNTTIPIRLSTSPIAPDSFPTISSLSYLSDLPFHSLPHLLSSSF